MGISGETAFPVFTVWKAERLNKAMIRKDGNITGEESLKRIVNMEKKKQGEIGCPQISNEKSKTYPMSIQFKKKYGAPTHIEGSLL